MVHYAVSLGHHRSLVCTCRRPTCCETSFRLTAEQEASYRAYAGDGLFRLSVGLEDAADIIADLDQRAGLISGPSRRAAPSGRRPRVRRSV